MFAESLDEARRLRQSGAVGEMDVVAQWLPFLFPAAGLSGFRLQECEATG